MPELTDAQKKAEQLRYEHALEQVAAGRAMPFLCLPYSRAPNDAEKATIMLWNESRQGEHFDEQLAHPFVRQLMAFAEALRGYK